MRQLGEPNLYRIELLPHCSFPFQLDRCKQFMYLQPFIHPFIHSTNIWLTTQEMSYIGLPTASRLQARLCYGKSHCVLNRHTWRRQVSERRMLFKKPLLVSQSTLDLYFRHSCTACVLHQTASSLKTEAGFSSCLSYPYYPLNVN